MPAWWRANLAKLRGVLERGVALGGDGPIMEAVEISGQ
jgi:hypothetical protein